MDILSAFINFAEKIHDKLKNQMYTEMSFDTIESLHIDMTNRLNGQLDWQLASGIDKNAQRN